MAAALAVEREKKVLCCVVDGVGVGVFVRFWVCVRVCVLCLCRRGRDLFVFMERKCGCNLFVFCLHLGSFREGRVNKTCLFCALVFVYV